MSTASESLRMGQSCSSQLEAEKAKNKQLEGRIRLYEKGITDKSLHASQTNIGLLTIANEDNSSGCNCSSQSLWGVLEVIAVMLACILLLYILYSCLVRYCSRRKVIREKRQRRLLNEVEARMGRSQTDNLMKPNLAIEMSPSAPECGRVHVPVYQTENSKSKSTQLFDSESLFECMNDLYEAGVDDDYLALLYEANKENFVAVQTPNGLSKREVLCDIVMQGDVLAPLTSSLQVDTFGKECLQENKHLFLFKNKVPIPPLGLVDDLFSISSCGLKTTAMNSFINTKTALKKLQFGTSKCIKLHVGKTCNETLCKDLYVDG